MSNPLASLLASLTPQEHDAHLSKIWKGFQGTDAQYALSLLLQNLTGVATRRLFTPALSPEERAYYSGSLAAITSVIETINTATAFEPSQADYTEPKSQSEEPPEEFSY